MFGCSSVSYEFWCSQSSTSTKHTVILPLKHQDETKPVDAVEEPWNPRNTVGSQQGPDVHKATTRTGRVDQTLNRPFNQFFFKGTVLLPPIEMMSVKIMFVFFCGYSRNGCNVYSHFGYAYARYHCFDHLFAGPCCDFAEATECVENFATSNDFKILQVIIFDKDLQCTVILIIIYLCVETS